MKIKILFFLLLFSLSLFSQNKRQLITKKFVTVDRLNFRPAPTYNCIRTKLLYKNDMVEILNIPVKPEEMTDRHINDGFFIQVKHDKDTGYVHNHYLSQKKLIEIRNPSDEDMIWIPPGNYSSLPYSEQLQWYIFYEKNGTQTLKEIPQPILKFNNQLNSIKYFHEPDTNAVLIAFSKKLCKNPKGYSQKNIYDFWKNPLDYDLKIPEGIGKKYRISYIEQNGKLLLQEFGTRGNLVQQVDLFIFFDYDKSWTWFSGINWYGDLNCDNLPDFLLTFCGEEYCYFRFMMSVEPNIYKSKKILSGEYYGEDY